MTLKKEPKVVTTVRRTFHVEYDAGAIRAALGYPADATVYFHVPGGADWSHTDIEIDDNHPIHITWETTEETEA